MTPPGDTADALASPPGLWFRLRARLDAAARSGHALTAMMLVAVIEGSLLPLPPFALLIPMCLSKPKRAVWYGLLGGVASTTGGALGWLIGHAAHLGLVSALDFNPNVPIALFGYEGTVGGALGAEFWLLSLLTGALPTPYKLTAIGAGLVDVPLPRFVLASLLGRGLRFLAVALFVAYARGWYLRLRGRREAGGAPP
ncbi:MAG: YqaA family protein [Myxococcales bacterium]